MTGPAICCVFSTFDRRNTTARFLEGLTPQLEERDVVIAVDSSSTDGTLELLQDCSGVNEVLQVPSDVYWAQAMRTGLERARDFESEWILLLNDDVEWRGEPLRALRERLAGSGPDSLFVGATKASSEPNAPISYGAHRIVKTLCNVGWETLPAGYSGRGPHVANANFLCFHRSWLEKVITCFRPYRHQYADFISSHALTSAGCGIHVLSEPIGICLNEKPPRWSHRSYGLRERWSRVNAAKGAPLREHLRLYWRIGGYRSIFALANWVRLILVGGQRH